MRASARASIKACAAIALPAALASAAAQGGQSAALGGDAAIAVLDAMKPHMNGLETLRRIRQQPHAGARADRPRRRLRPHPAGTGGRRLRRQTVRVARTRHCRGTQSTGIRPSTFPDGAGEQFACALDLHHARCAPPDRDAGAGRMAWPQRSKTDDLYGKAWGRGDKLRERGRRANTVRRRVAVAAHAATSIPCDRIVTMSIAWLFAHLAFSCLLLAPCARAAIELRVAAQEETAPKYIKGHGGAVAGMCVDLLRALERVDPELRFVGGERWFPLIRVQSELFARHQDVACGLAHTTERDRHLTFLDPPLLAIDYVLIARADDNVGIGGWNDVRRLGWDGVVLGNRGLFASEFLASIGGIYYDTGSATAEQNLKKLLLRRGRFFLQRAQGVNQMLLQAGLSDRLRVLPTVMGSAQLYLTVGKHVDETTTERLRGDLARVQATGELALIRKRWYPPGP
jgi:polar amino acid transport system substrate-binding protein